MAGTYKKALAAGRWKRRMERRSGSHKKRKTQHTPKKKAQNTKTQNRPEKLLCTSTHEMRARQIFDRKKDRKSRSDSWLGGERRRINHFVLGRTIWEGREIYRREEGGNGRRKIKNFREEPRMQSQHRKGKETEEKRGGGSGRHSGCIPNRGEKEQRVQFC